MTAVADIFIIDRFFYFLLSRYLCVCVYLFIASVTTTAGAANNHFLPWCCRIPEIDLFFKRALYSISIGCCICIAFQSRSVPVFRCHLQSCARNHLWMQIHKCSIPKYTHTTRKEKNLFLCISWINELENKCWAPLVTSFLVDHVSVGSHVSHDYCHRLNVASFLFLFSII